MAHTTEPTQHIKPRDTCGALIRPQPVLSQGLVGTEKQQGIRTSKKSNGLLISPFSWAVVPRTFLLLASKKDTWPRVYASVSSRRCHVSCEHNPEEVGPWVQGAACPASLMRLSKPKMHPGQPWLYFSQPRLGPMPAKARAGEESELACKVNGTGEVATPADSAPRRCTLVDFSCCIAPTRE